MAGMEKDSTCMVQPPVGCCENLRLASRPAWTVTLVDGLVLSRSAFDHSMNYGCVVAFGTSRKIADLEQKVKSLRVVFARYLRTSSPPDGADVRGPSEKELKTTTVLEFSSEEASSKVRSGPPLDDESDYGLPVWAGVLPLEIKSRPPIPDDKLVEGITVPDYVRRNDARLAGHTEIRNFPIPSGRA